MGRGRRTDFGGFACGGKKDGFVVVVVVVESGGVKKVCKAGLNAVIGPACVVNLGGKVGLNGEGNLIYAVKGI